MLINDLQVDDEQGFIKFFKTLPANDSDTVRIFDRGDSFTAHGRDAVFIAQTVRLHYMSSPADI